MNVYNIAKQYSALANLADSDIPEEAVNDTLEGLEGEFNTKAEAMAFAYKNLLVESVAIKDAAKSMATRAAILERKAENIKQFLRDAMIAKGEKTVKSTYLAIKFKKNPPSVVVDNEAVIPKQYFDEIPATEKVNKKRIAEALKSGETVDGAFLKQEERLEIK